MVCGITQVSAAAPASTPTPAKAVAPSSEAYRPGQQWIVPGEWQFTIDAVRPVKVNIHDDGGGSWRPTQVLLVSYSYRNIGFDDSANYKKVVVSHYDSRLQLQQATFIVPVETTRQSSPHAKRHVRHS